MPPAEKIGTIRLGMLTVRIVEAIEHYRIPKSVMLGIVGIPKSTFDRKLKAEVRLSQAETERLARLIEVEDFAEEVFSSKEKSHEWLNKKHTKLGESPISLLDTETGAAQVRKVLGAIAYGGVV